MPMGRWFDKGVRRETRAFEFVLVFSFFSFYNLWQSILVFLISRVLSDIYELRATGEVTVSPPLSAIHGLRGTWAFCPASHVPHL